MLGAVIPGPALRGRSRLVHSPAWSGFVCHWGVCHRVGAVSRPPTAPLRGGFARLGPTVDPATSGPGHELGHGTAFGGAVLLRGPGAGRRTRPLLAGVRATPGPRWGLVLDAPWCARARWGLVGGWVCPLRARRRDNERRRGNTRRRRVTARWRRRRVPLRAPGQGAGSVRTGPVPALHTLPTRAGTRKGNVDR